MPGWYMLPNAESPSGDPAVCALGLEPTHQHTGVLFAGVLVAGVQTDAQWQGQRATGEPGKLLEAQ